MENEAYTSAPYPDPQASTESYFYSANSSADVVVVTVIEPSYPSSE